MEVLIFLVAILITVGFFIMIFALLSIDFFHEKGKITTSNKIMNTGLIMALGGLFLLVMGLLLVELYNAIFNK